MSSEKESLIKQGNNSKGQSTGNLISLKHLVLFPSVLFQCIGAGIIGYVLNEWTQYKIKTVYFPEGSVKNNITACGNRNHSSETYQKYKTVQQETSQWMIYYNLAIQITSCVSNIIIPSYTDTYGRKLFFVLSTFGQLIRAFVLVLVIYANGNLIFVVIAYAAGGLAGSSYALFCGTFSFVADVTVTEKQRVVGVVIMEALLLLSSMLSSLLSGYLIQTLRFGFLNTALISTVLISISFFIVVFFLPETLSKENRLQQKSFIQTAKRTFDFYISKEFKGKRLCYVLLLLSFTFHMLSSSHRTTLEILYFLGQPFCWDPADISYFSFARHTAIAFVGLGSLKLLQKCMSNEAIAVLSTISNAGSYVLEAFAKTTLMIYMVPVAGVFSFLITPMIRGIMSNITSTNKQGSMFASIAVVENIACLVGSSTQNEIYSATLSIMNGFVFLVLAGLCAINLVLLLTYCYVKPYNNIHISKGNDIHNTENSRAN